MRSRAGRLGVIGTVAVAVGAFGMLGATSGASAEGPTTIQVIAPPLPNAADTAITDLGPVVETPVPDAGTSGPTGTAPTVTHAEQTIGFTIEP